MIVFHAVGSPPDYEESLRGLIDTDVDVVLAGHGDPFVQDRLGDRCLRLRAGRSERVLR